MWILTYYAHDYNQYGEYYQKAWKDKPTADKLITYLETIGLDKVIAFGSAGRVESLLDGQWVDYGIKEYRLFEEDEG